MTTAERITRARAALILDAPFFGALSLRLNLKPVPGIQTAETNGRVIRYNPAWIDTLSDPELRGIIAHEVLHCAAGHCWRRDGRDAAQWNVACDRAINHHITAAGLTLPADALPGDDRSAEQIFADGATEPGGNDNPAPMPQPGGAGAGAGVGAGSADQQSGDGGPDAGAGAGPGAGAGSAGGNGGNGQAPGGGAPDPGGCGAVCDAPADDTGAGSADDWKVATVQAAMAAKGMGNLPGIAERLLAEFTRPPVDWRTVLADFVQRTARNDYSWNVPNVRHVRRGFILPALSSNELSDVVVCVDTSGSIGDKELAAFCGAVSDVLSAYPMRLHALAIDARVQGYREYEAADLPIDPDTFPHDGGGGTSFSPAFTWIEERGLTPDAVIYLTDLDGTFPDPEPDYPVLWVTIDPERSAPFGQVLPMPV